MSECEIYSGCLNSDGYGIRWWDGKTERAHRVAFSIARGVTMEAIAGLLVLHRCAQRACVNPEHLELGTHDLNMADMAASNRKKKLDGAQ